ncbi:MAG: nucleotidyltransferase domain-containing protein [Chloroflexi bacterium]|nr:nucleotidyltransferase domain-containing protein [Chloroflexota bacterium]
MAVGWEGHFGFSDIAEVNSPMHLSELKSHERIVKGIEEFVRADSNCSGLVLGGSFCRGTADENSDIDLWVIISDVNRITETLQNLSATFTKIGKPLFVQTRANLLGDEIFMRRVIFEDMVSCTIHMTSASDFPAPPRTTPIILVDKQENLEATSKSEFIPLVRDEFDDILGDFIFGSSAVFRAFIRGELWGAIFYLNLLRLPLFQSIRLSADIASLIPGCPNKRFEMDMPEMAQKGLNETLPAYSSESISSAFRYIVLRYLDVSHQIAVNEKFTEYLEQEELYKNILNYWLDQLGSSPHHAGM